MTTIDHATEALDHIHNANIAAGDGEYASSDLEVKTAQVHATLALAEQQRIANLIALSVPQSVPSQGDEATVCIPSFGEGFELRDDIKKGLGL